VPQVFRVPGDTLVPPTGTDIGARDAVTGEILPGVLAVTVKASADAKDAEITAKLSEIAVPDPERPGIGYPARTIEDVQAAISRHGRAHDLPWVRNLYRVVGFEIGAARSPFFDPEQFAQDVSDVKRHLGIEDE